MSGSHGQELSTPSLGDQQELTARLARNRESIRNGTAFFNGIRISYQTELTRYERVTAKYFLYTGIFALLCI
jgi:hypothetical protein